MSLITLSSSMWGETEIAFTSKSLILISRMFLCAITWRPESTDYQRDRQFRYHVFLIQTWDALIESGNKLGQSDLLGGSFV